MDDLRPAGPQAYSGVLDGPIKVKRRRRLRHKWLWLLLLVALAIAYLVVRVATVTFPVFGQRVVAPGDEWRLLRGAFHLAPGGDPGKDLPEAVQEAFDQGLEFLVVIGPDMKLVQQVAARSPLAVVAAQSIDTEFGRLAAVRPEQPLESELSVPGAFERIEQAGAWSVVLNPVREDDPWLNWDVHGYDAIEFFDSEQHFSSMSFSDKLGHWVGSLLGSPYANVYLGSRPTSGLAHWDDECRIRKLPGFCSLGRADECGSKVSALSTYLYVVEGLGPYGPDAVERALKEGRHFCALPFLGDPGGFRFEIHRAGSGERLGMIGQRVTFEKGLKLVGDLNLEADSRDVIFHVYLDGREIVTRTGSRLAIPVEMPGAYRVEIGVLLADIPWGQSERRFLYSNPIYVLKEP